MGQYPPSGTRRPFGDDEEDDDFDSRNRYGDTGRTGGPTGPERQFNYNPDERYWTDYIRIALPVLGVILLLGLAWFWVNNLIGGDNSNNGTSGAVASPTSVLPPIFSGSPTTTTGLGQPTRLPSTPTAAKPASGTPAATGTAKLQAGGKAVISAGGTGVNMRADPSTSAKIVAKLPDGTTVTITGDSKQADNYTWWPVKYNNDSGWIVADFLKPAA